MNIYLRCGRTARVGSPKDCRVTNFICRPLEILLTQKIEKTTRMMKDLPICDYLKQNWIPPEEEEVRRPPKRVEEKSFKDVIEEPLNEEEDVIEVDEEN